jgi:hypothetical protein
MQADWKGEELYKAFNVAPVIDGSSLIPYLQNAVDSLDLVRSEWSWG